MRSRIRIIAAAAAAGAALIAGGSGVEALADVPIYSFEVLYNDLGQPDPGGTRPDGFHPNGGLTTVTQDTIGATLGTKSVKFTQNQFATFTALQTEILNPALDATTTYGISFDLTVPATGAFAGNFARIAVSEFGDTHDPEPVNLQVQAASYAEQNINLEGGRTYHMTLPLIALFNPVTFDLHVPFSSIFGPGASQLTPTSWELFVNKSAESELAALTIYLDNVQAVTNSVGVWNSDSSGNWSDTAKWNTQPASGINTFIVPNGADTTVILGGISVSDARTITLTQAQTVGRIELNGTGTFTLGGTGTLSLDVTSGQATVDVHRGVHVVSAPLVLNDNTTFKVSATASQLTTSNLQTTTSAITKTGGGILLANNVRAGGLAVNEGSVRIAADGTNTGTSRVGALTFAGGATPTATLDLNDNDLIVTSGTYAAITNAIAKARNGGLWNQPGLTSSAAAAATPKNKTLGTITGAQLISTGVTNFDGFTVAASDVLVKFTWYGDTDFNGVVNFDDYSRTDTGFNTGGTTWFAGDFDYNNLVNFDDYSLIDLAFNTQSGTLRDAITFLDGSDRNDSKMTGPGLQKVLEHFNQFGEAYASSFLNAVPEPTSALFGVPALAGMALRRRRR